MMRRSLPLFLMPVLLCALPRAARAQAPGVLVEAARTQLENIQPDTAAALLQRVVDPRTNAGAGEQLRAWTLLGVAELMRGRTQAARFAFRRSLDRDPQLRVDSLAYLHSDLRRVFAAERDAVRLDTDPPALIGLRTAADTSVMPAEGRFIIEVQPRRRAKVLASVAPARGGDAIWSDSITVNLVGQFEWDLMTGSTPLAPGRYILRMSATDPVSGRALQPITRTFTVAHTAVDTLDSPPPPTDQLLPDTIVKRSTSTLVAGLALGAGAIALTSVMGNNDLNSGGSGNGRYLVAGTVSVAAITAFFAGRHSRPAPANVSYNQQLLSEYDDRVRDTANENRRRVAAAPLRIRMQVNR